MTWRAARRAHLLRLLGCDLIALALAFTLAYLLRLQLPLGILYLPLNFYIPAALLLGAVILVVFVRQRLYTRLPGRPLATELLAATGGITLAMALFIAGAFWVRDLSLSRLLMGLTWLLLVLLISAGRILARGMWRAAINQGARQRVLLVGNAIEEEAVRRIYSTAAAAGTIALEERSEADPVRLLEAVRADACDELVVHGAQLETEDIFRLGGAAARQGIALKVVPPGAALAALPVAFEAEGGVPLLEVGQGLLDPAAQLGKRLLDLTLCLLSFLPALLVALPVALLIKLSAPAAPVLFRQERLGRGGRRIRICKFRTMVPGAEALLEQDPELRKQFEEDYKLKDDPRQTPLGRFLRKTSLDEIPQWWNILVGDMSFVGPRPIVPPELAKYGAYGDLLLAAAPGLTGLWQVSGRSDVSYGERIALDMLYIERWSIVLDLQILALTIPAVLRRKGAA